MQATLSPLVTPVPIRCCSHPLLFYRIRKLGFPLIFLISPGPRNHKYSSSARSTNLMWPFSCDTQCTVPACSPYFLPLPSGMNQPAPSEFSSPSSAHHFHNEAFPSGSRVYFVVVLISPCILLQAHSSASTSLAISAFSPSSNLTCSRDLFTFIIYKTFQLPFYSPEPLHSPSAFPILNPLVSYSPCLSNLSSTRNLFIFSLTIYPFFLFTRSDAWFPLRAGLFFHCSIFYPSSPSISAHLSHPLTTFSVRSAPLSAL